MTQIWTINNKLKKKFDILCNINLTWEGEQKILSNSLSLPLPSWPHIVNYAKPNKIIGWSSSLKKLFCTRTILLYSHYSKTNFSVQTKWALIHIVACIFLLKIFFTELPPAYMGAIHFVGWFFGKTRGVRDYFNGPLINFHNNNNIHISKICKLW